MPQTINNMVATWNNAATTYTAIKMNVPTDVSAAGSLLMDLQVGGSSRFSVAKNGNINLKSGTVAADIASNNAGALLLNSSNAGDVWSYGILRAQGGTITFNSADLFLTRRAAANLRLGAADAAGSAIAISSVASNQLTLASAHGLTTGAAIIITGSVAPSGTTLNTRYYARVIAAAVIELYSTYDQATAASGTTGRISVTTAGTSAFVNLATPFQSFGVQDFTGTDIPGQPFIIRGSRGTGTGPGGDLIFQVAPAGTAGSSQNALATALTIGADRNLISTGNLTLAGGSIARLLTSGGGAGATAFNIITHHVGLTAYIEGVNQNPALGVGSSGNTYNGVFTNLTGYFGFYEFNNTAPDVRLYRDNSGILALRNGANAQTFRVYNTWTSFGSGTEIWERGKFAWESNVLTIGTEKGANGGTARTMVLQTDGTTRVTLNNSAVIEFSYSQFNLGGGARIYAISNGVLGISNSGNADGSFVFGAFASNTKSRLTPSGTTLQVRLGDDSAFASIQGKLTTETAYTAGAPTATGYLVLYDSNGTAYRVPAVLN